MDAFSDAEVIFELSEEALGRIRIASPEAGNLVRSSERRANGLEIAGGDLRRRW
jgi:hypothetical protein